MTTATGDRSGLQVLKDRLGPLPKELLDRVRAQNAAKTAIRKALKGGPLTVPEIAEAASLGTKDVLWYVTAMRKYGQVVEDVQDGDYMRYALAPEAPR
jgi:predicted transcriptional regulator